MTAFQHLAVRVGDGPHVTLAAGIEMAGRSWSTTSTAAVKVDAIRSHPHAAVLLVGDDPSEWTLRAGRATVLDVRRPLDGLGDPVAASLAGVALARIGLSNLDQLVGYARDADGVPKDWNPTSRVLLVVHHDHRLTVRDGVVVDSTGAFAGTLAQPPPSRRRRRRLDPRVAADLSVAQAALVSLPGPCALGLLTAVGPVVVPAWWDPAAGAIVIDPSILGHLRAELPGPCCVTFDESSDASPLHKVGVMLRGRADLLGRVGGGGVTNGDRQAVLPVSVGRVTAWTGFVVHHHVGGLISALMAV